MNSQSQGAHAIWFCIPRTWHKIDAWWINECVNEGCIYYPHPDLPSSLLKNFFKVHENIDFKKIIFTLGFGKISIFNKIMCMWVCTYMQSLFLFPSLSIPQYSQAVILNITSWFFPQVCYMFLNNSFSGQCWKVNVRNSHAFQW
jgi:hypothetical protein